MSYIFSKLAKHSQNTASSLMKAAFAVSGEGAKQARQARQNWEKKRRDSGTVGRKAWTKRGQVEKKRWDSGTLTGKLHVNQQFSLSHFMWDIWESRNRDARHLRTG